MSSSDALLQAIATLVADLPEDASAPLADALARATPGAWAEIQATALHLLAAPRYREQVRTLLRVWQAEASATAPESMALALRAAAQTLRQQRRAQMLELVWTGPSSSQPLRRTAQVLQGLLDEARQSLLIVSFAVYDIPEVRAALLRAAARGVQIHLVVESPRASAGKVAYDGLAALGPQVAASAQVYCWPADKRPSDSAGHHGSLHAKCAVADGQTMLISSANLTHYALALNMELGLLVRGGPLPRQVAEHFKQLMEQKTLVAVE